VGLGEHVVPPLTYQLANQCRKGEEKVFWGDFMADWSQNEQHKEGKEALFQHSEKSQSLSGC